MSGSRINNFFGFSSFTLIVSFVCLALLGAVFIPKVPVKLVPSQDMPGLTVRYSVRNASSRVIEAEVTSKLEGVLARVKGVKSISSSSNNGNGSISLSFDKHADLAAVRFDVAMAVRQVWQQLPEEAGYPQISMKQSDSEASRPFLTYTLNAPAEPSVIQKYGENTIEPVLAQIEGVDKVELTGAMPMEWILTYDSEQLENTGLTTEDIRKAIQGRAEREFIGIGRIQRENGREERMRIVLMAEDAAADFNVSDISVKGKNGDMIPLSRLVKVEHREAEPDSYFRINGLNSIYLSITATQDANQIETGKAVREKLAELAERMPSGYELHKSYDATEYIQSELDTIYFRTSLTVLILLLFVLAITRSWRYLLLITISLSVTLLIAFIFYYVFGLEMQLYSMAGITISLNLVIDNTIVMADHIMRRRNLKAFMSVLAATLTTMGALVIIFFMNEKVRLNLQDFAAVVIINLAVSLLVALFMVPALISRMNMLDAPAGRRPAVKAMLRRWTVRFTRLYFSFIGWMCRYRVAACILLVLVFGLPVFMLPEKMEGEGWKAEWYNRTVGSDTYQKDIRPYVDKILGGTLRLFADKVYTGNYFSNKREVMLSVNASLPNGSTLEQMNGLISQMEAYLSEFREIKQFQTSVQSANRASIRIFFTKESENTGFPYTLKANIISKALELGGGSWNVYGLEDQGFSNDVREQAGNNRVQLTGYNYDELMRWAEIFKDSLLTYRRIKEVSISSDFSIWKDDYTEFYLKLDKKRMIEENITAYQLFSALQPVFGKDISCGTIWVNEEAEQLKLASRQADLYDVWALQNLPFEAGGRSYKVSDFASVTKEQAPQKIKKRNQEYVLCLQYDYIGSYVQSKKILEKEIEEFSKILPMGYRIENKENTYGWNDKEVKKEYFLLLLVIGIIFITTSILFNSLKQPLAIIFTIPISYIGVFLTFYLFELDFDQGGFAAFVLLCGITVNASIYILNEYNNICRLKPKLSGRSAYVKAWNAKVIPIFLTVVSTILGFVPFMTGEEKEAFWFPLAAGTIGGLVMSLIGIFFYLPIFSLSLKKNR